MAKVSKGELASAVIKHAYANYSDPDVCWDVLIECYELDELIEMVGNCRTVAGAIRKAKSYMPVRVEF